MCMWYMYKLNALIGWHYMAIKHYKPIILNSMLIEDALIEQFW